MSWIATRFCGSFSYLVPEENSLDIRDIAWALAHQCRFNEHCRTFYSVAEHCCYASLLSRDPLGALLHDAAEAYIGDFPTPLKRLLPQIREIEESVLKCIGRCLEIDPDRFSSIEMKQVDALMLATERRDLLDYGPAWEIELPAPSRQFSLRGSRWPLEIAFCNFIRCYSRYQASKFWTTNDRDALLESSWR